jgi:hypothetical protein
MNLPGGMSGESGSFGYYNSSTWRYMMKRLIIAAVVLVAMTATAGAQGEIPDYFGVKGGLNYVKLNGDDVDDADYMMGYAVGGFYQYQVNPKFAVVPEFYYTVKGAKEADTEFELKLAYVEIPVLFKLTIPKGNKIPFVYGGGYFSFLTSAKMEEVDVKDEVASTDAGLVFGAGIEFPISSGEQLINLDVRYSWGLMNIDKDEEEDSGKVYNGGFQFLLGWGFSL